MQDCNRLQPNLRQMFIHFIYAEEHQPVLTRKEFSLSFCGNYRGEILLESAGEVSS